MRSKILGKPFQIIERPVSEMPDCLGTYDLDKMEIYIREGLTPAQRASTILHENLHIGDETLGLGLTEAQVSGLEVALYSAGCRITVKK